MNDKGVIALDDLGLLRLPKVLQIFPVSRATWWSGVRSGEYPKPVKMGKRAVGWRSGDIRKLLEKIQ